MSRDAFKKVAGGLGYSFTLNEFGAYNSPFTESAYLVFLATLEHCKQGEPFGYVMQPAFWEGMRRSTICQDKRGSYQIPLFAHAMPKSEGIEKYLQEIHEVRHCDYCHHVGVDDAAKDMASCSSCGWNGEEPKADICPACGVENHMMATCPKCNEQYGLVEYVTTASTPQPTTDISELLNALEEAVRRSYNPFEPDNQHPYYHRWVAIIAKNTVKA